MTASRKIPEINYDDPFEVELCSVVGKYLWQAFESAGPDTPPQVFRVVLFALRENGYTITRQGGNE